MKLPKGRRYPRIGRLPYLVTTPFTFEFPGAETTVEWITAPPRQLGHLAREDELDAACVPALDVRALSRRFEPLGDLGIACTSGVPLALFVARIEADLLGKAPIGITDQGASTVQLLEVILVNRYGVETPHLVPLSPDRRQFGGWLTVGDDALALSRTEPETFDHRYDLLAEWHAWTTLPFVLGRWVVRKALPDAVKEELYRALSHSLDRAMNDQSAVVRRHAGEHARRWDETAASGYLQGCIYRLTERELESIEHFAHLVRDLRPQKTSWRHLLETRQV